MGQQRRVGDVGAGQLDHRHHLLAAPHRVHQVRRCGPARGRGLQPRRFLGRGADHQTPALRGYPPQQPLTRSDAPSRHLRADGAHRGLGVEALALAVGHEERASEGTEGLGEQPQPAFRGGVHVGSLVERRAEAGVELHQGRALLQLALSCSQRLAHRLDRAPQVPQFVATFPPDARVLPHRDALRHRRQLGERRSSPFHSDIAPSSTAISSATSAAASRARARSVCSRAARSA